MKRLVFTDDIGQLGKSVIGGIGNADYVIFDDSNLGRQAEEYLSGRTGFRAAGAKDLYRRHGEWFRAEYIEFMGALNECNADRSWWAHDFTAKNMLATNLGQNIFHAYLCAQLLAQDSTRTLVVVARDSDLRGQLREWCAKSGIDFIFAGRRRFQPRLITEIIPVYLLFYFLRTIFYTATMRRELRFRPGRGKYVVVASLVNPQSFDARGAYRDAYFGPLLDVLARDRPALVFGIPLGDYRGNIRAIKASRHGGIVPTEYFLRLRDIAGCFGQTLVNYARGVRLQGQTEFGGVDVGYLLRRLIRRDNSRNYFTNLLFYYCAVALTREIDVGEFIYPFENRAFEKMFILAMAGVEPHPKTVGYNHASVTLKHTNLFLSECERTIVPLPDRVVTLGKESRQILVERGGLPASTVHVGCGLRQSAVVDLEMHSRPHALVSVLIVLTAEVEEYVGILSFLNQAFPEGSERYRFLIRPHPVTPLSHALERIDLTFDHVDVGTVSLDQNLSEADVVLYTSSTVGVEALGRGLPVVHLDVGDIISTDPLFRLDTFKWAVTVPSELPAALDAIEAVSESEYLKAQEVAMAFAHDYIYPATESNLNRFAELVTA